MASALLSIAGVLEIAFGFGKQQQVWALCRLKLKKQSNLME
jgi:hypothetical protein